jgi:hypothetical protein
MKKIFLLLITLWSAYVSMGQSNDVDKNAALQLVSANRAAIGLSPDDLNNVLVSSSYKMAGATDVTLVYLYQSYKGIPVYNQMQVLAFRNGKVVLTRVAVLMASLQG